MPRAADLRTAFLLGQKRTKECDGWPGQVRGDNPPGALWELAIDVWETRRPHPGPLRRMGAARSARP